MTTTGNTPNQDAAPTDNTQTAPPQDVNDLMGAMVNNPSLPTGGQVTVQNQVEGPGEIVDPLKPIDVKKATQTLATAPQKVQVQAPQAAIATAQGLDSNKYQSLQEKTLAENQGYTADTIGDINMEANAARGQIAPEDTVRGQLAIQQQDFQNGMPVWAQGAARAVNEEMAARGMGASSLAGAAITTAIMEAGIKIASQDAETYAKMKMANTEFSQQAAMKTFDARMQVLLSDQAAVNAAKQFNSSNKADIAKYFAGLIQDADKFSVQQMNAMAESNAARQQQANITGAELQTQADLSWMQNSTQVQLANAEQANLLSKFSAEQDNNMAKFLAENAQIVAQSNATWRRQINTNNTAAINQANQTNALNALSISNQALANIWQKGRDEASWVFQAGESQKDRMHALALAAINKQAALDITKLNAKGDMLEAVGKFIFDLLK